MRASIRGLLACIAALALLTPVAARAQTPGWHVPILTGLTCPAGAYSLDLTGAPICFNGITYPSIVQAPGWSYTRAGAATASDAAGNVIPFAANVPRITSAGYTGELAATNLLQQSQSWASGFWGVIDAGAALSNNTDTAPDGTSTVSTFTEASTSAIHGIFIPVVGSNPVVSSGATISESVYLKAGTRRYVQVWCGNGTAVFWITVDTQNWAITEASAIGAGVLTSDTLTPAANGSFRATITGSLTGQTSYHVDLLGSPCASGCSNAPSYAGNGSTIKGWGFQFEVGSIATSYIPTTSASATRAADNGLISGLSVKTPVTTVTQAANVAAGLAVNQMIAVLGDGTSSNFFMIERGTGATGTIAAVPAGSAVASVSGGVISLRQAASADGAAVKLSANGSAVGSTAAVGALSFTTLYIGRYWNDTVHNCDCNVKSIKIISNANGNLQALSSGQ